jgi:dihydroxyacetone kinase
MIYHARSKAGVLLLIYDNQNDIVNFRLAQQICGQKFGIKIETLIISDNVGADWNSRGIAAGVFLYKLIGAGAEKGVGLRELKNYGQKILRNIGSGSGVGLGEKSELLESKEMVKLMLERIVENLDIVNVDSGCLSDLVLMVNYSGGATENEVGVVVGDC